MSLKFSKVDLNQKSIVKTFRQLGYSVLHIHMVKKCFDILVAKNGLVSCIEVKTGKAKLTSDEEVFHSTWKAKIYILRTIEDVIEFDRLAK